MVQILLILSMILMDLILAHHLKTMTLIFLDILLNNEVIKSITNVSKSIHVITNQGSIQEFRLAGANSNRLSHLRVLKGALRRVI